MVALLIVELLLPVEHFSPLLPQYCGRHHNRSQRMPSALIGLTPNFLQAGPKGMTFRPLIAVDGTSILISYIVAIGPHYKLVSAEPEETSGSPSFGTIFDPVADLHPG
jgi:hypothetical protein